MGADRFTRLSEQFLETQDRAIVAQEQRIARLRALHARVSPENREDVSAAIARAEGRQRDREKRRRALQ